MLTEYKDNHVHYFVDERGMLQGTHITWDYANPGIIRDIRHYVDNVQQGEHKRWYRDGNLAIHDFFVDGRLHGEYKFFWEDGTIKEHGFYYNSDNITDDVISVISDITKLSDADRVIINLRYGFRLC